MGGLYGKLPFYEIQGATLTFLAQLAIVLVT